MFINWYRPLIFQSMYILLAHFYQIKSVNGNYFQTGEDTLLHTQKKKKKTNLLNNIIFKIRPTKHVTSGRWNTPLNVITSVPLKLWLACQILGSWFELFKFHLLLNLIKEKEWENFQSQTRNTKYTIQSKMKQDEMIQVSFFVFNLYVSIWICVFFCCRNVHEELKADNVKCVMARKGWLLGEKGGHHRFSGIDSIENMYMFRRNVILSWIISMSFKLLPLTLTWEWLKGSRLHAKKGKKNAKKEKHTRKKKLIQVKNYRLI